VSLIDPAKGPGIDIPRAKQALKQLERYAPFIHRKRPILSFSGVEPSNPSLTPPPAGVLDPLALDLATWLDEPVVQAGNKSSSVSRLNKAGFPCHTTKRTAQQRKHFPAALPPMPSRRSPSKFVPSEG